MFPPPTTATNALDALPDSFRATLSDEAKRILARTPVSYSSGSRGWYDPASRAISLPQMNSQSSIIHEALHALGRQMGGPLGVLSRLNTKQSQQVTGDYYAKDPNKKVTWSDQYNAIRGWNNSGPIDLGAAKETLAYRGREGWLGGMERFAQGFDTLAGNNYAWLPPAQQAAYAPLFSGDYQHKAQEANVSWGDEPRREHIAGSDGAYPNYVVQYVVAPNTPAYDPSKGFRPLPPPITASSTPLLPNYGRAPKATLNTIRKKANTYRERGR